MSATISEALRLRFRATLREHLDMLRSERAEGRTPEGVPDPDPDPQVVQRAYTQAIRDVQAAGQRAGFHPGEL